MCRSCHSPFAFIFKSMRRRVIQVFFTAFCSLTAVTFALALEASLPRSVCSLVGGFLPTQLLRAGTRQRLPGLLVCSLHTS